MDRLHFGARAQRRARRARFKRTLFVAWCIALVAGVPGATAALDWVRDAAGSDTTRANVVPVRQPLPDGHEAGLVAKELKTKLTEEPAYSYGGSVTEIIYAAAAEFGLDGSYLLSVAECESGLDPSAYNSAGYYGLFQFDQTTWAAYGYGSIYDPVAQARTSARLLAAGQSSRWPNCA